MSNLNPDQFGKFIPKNVDTKGGEYPTYEGHKDTHDRIEAEDRQASSIPAKLRPGIEKRLSKN